jgi:hypothetical protein
MSLDDCVSRRIAPLLQRFSTRQPHSLTAVIYRSLATPCSMGPQLHTTCNQQDAMSQAKAGGSHTVKLPKPHNTLACSSHPHPQPPPAAASNSRVGLCNSMLADTACVAAPQHNGQCSPRQPLLRLRKPHAPARAPAYGSSEGQLAAHCMVSSSATARAAGQSETWLWLLSYNVLQAARLDFQHIK